MLNNIIMKKNSCLLLLITALPLLMMAQWPGEVTVVESIGNDSVIVSGDLANGKKIEDLRWASNSSNACFPTTQNIKFMGNHVFFTTAIPPHSIMNISVMPADDTANLSIYAYMSGTQEHYLVPNLPSCITCEADHKWDGKWKGKIQTAERKVEFNNPTDRYYNILIGVTAPIDVTTGQFNLKIKVKT
jgi:hypothetical protein